MPTTFTPGDNKQEDKLNPGQQDYDRRFNDLARAEERAAFDNIVNNYDQNAAADQEDENIERARNGEYGAQGAPGQQPEWVDRTSPETSSRTKITSKITLKRAAPALGIGGMLGIIIFLLGGWLPTMLLPSLSQGAVSENDARGTLIERRLVAKLQQKMTNNGPCDTKLSMCRDTKMPKVMLSSMAKKGIVAVDANGTPVDVDGTGYVDNNPTHYKYTGSGGEKIIPAGQFVDEYKSNPAFRKLFKSAYNARYMSYTGGFMKKILDKWGVKKDGGALADPEFVEDNAHEKVAEATRAGADDTSESGAKKTFRERAKTLLQRSANKASKTGGDPILLVGTGVCMAVSMPTFIAGTVRAIQLAQVVALTSNFILSASDMLRANEAEPEQVSALGKTLTDKFAVEGEDTMKSAVDSAVLLAATGAATGAMLKPSKNMPGYSLFSSSVVQGSAQLSGDMKQTCNLINSPQAAVASAGLTAGIGAATGGVGAAVKVALQAMGKVMITIGAIQGFITVLEKTGVLGMIADTAYGFAVGLLGNIYEDAQGLEFGDALGAGLFATFSLAALGGGAAVLTKSQARGFAQISAQVDNEYREEAIATLSPFDVSSQYTFLGSIVSKLAISSSGSSNMVSSAISAVGSILKSPMQLLGSSASAEVDPIEAKYGYASYYGVDEDIAVTVAGTPGVGLPAEYVDMAPGTASELVSDSFDPLTGEVYQPTPDVILAEQTVGGKSADIARTIEDCADADLETMSGCTVAGSTSSTVVSATCSEGNNCDEDSLAVSNVVVEGDVTAQESAAQRVYYVDHQIENIWSGNDKEEAGAGTDSVAGVAIDMANLYEDSTGVACAQNTIDKGTNTGYVDGRAFQIRVCALPNSDEPSKPEGMALVNSRVSGAAYAMLEQMKKDLAAKGVNVSKIPFGDSYRSPEKQQEAINSCGLYSNGGCAAAQGYSNHQSGVALDFEYNNNYCVHRRGITTCPASPYWTWLNEHAGEFGFKNEVDEWWHWSPTGG